MSLSPPLKKSDETEAQNCHDVFLDEYAAQFRDYDTIDDLPEEE